MAEHRRDFADILDEIVADQPSVRISVGAAPKLQVDLLEQIERLQAENASLFATEGRTAYDGSRDALDDVLPEVEEVLNTLMPDLPTNPDEISAELKLDRAMVVSDVDRIRRTFAFANHPDRLSPHLRERAEERMRVANMLIDSAKASLKSR